MSALLCVFFSVTISTKNYALRNLFQNSFFRPAILNTTSNSVILCRRVFVMKLKTSRMILWTSRTDESRFKFLIPLRNLCFSSRVLSFHFFAVFSIMRLVMFRTLLFISTHKIGCGGGTRTLGDRRSVAYETTDIAANRPRN